MKITASVNTDYLFNPFYGELNNFRRKFGEKSKQVDGGFTLSAYSNKDLFLIKDKVYVFDDMTYIPKKTESFSSVTDAMRSLNLTVSVESGKFLNDKRGLINYYASYLEYSKLGFILNQVPQINAIYKLNGGEEMVLLGINGNYDFDTELFHGVLDVISYDDFLINKGNL